MSTLCNCTACNNLNASQPASISASPSNPSCLCTLYRTECEKLTRLLLETKRLNEKIEKRILECKQSLDHSQFSLRSFVGSLFSTLGKLIVIALLVATIWYFLHLLIGIPFVTLPLIRFHA